jgi:hypothetical protein
VQGTAPGRFAHGPELAQVGQGDNFDRFVDLEKVPGLQQGGNVHHGGPHVAQVVKVVIDLANKVLLGVDHVAVTNTCFFAAAGMTRHRCAESLDLVRQNLFSIKVEQGAIVLITLESLGRSARTRRASWRARATLAWAS